MRAHFRWVRGWDLYTISQMALLAGAIAGAALTSRGADWEPIPVVLMLGILAVAAHAFAIQIGNQRLSPSFVALALAMVLLGPGPATAMGILTMFADGLWKRKPWRAWLSNIATYAVFPLAGGLLARALLTIHLAPGRVPAVQVALVLLGVYAVTNLLNFFLVALYFRVVSGRLLGYQIRNLLLPMLPSEAAAVLLTSLVAGIYASVHNGEVVLGGLIVVLGVFITLVRALARSEERADQLAARSTQLAHLQVGVLSTLLETLALRDQATARHGAAVARLAQALAKQLSLTEREQELVYTAGLLHDIGKFALPDRILQAGELSPEDLGLVKRHSQDGAALVGRLDGYGPVAEIILYHHERIDGTGYPAGLIGREIPLLARLVAVCETYDVLTGRDSYRPAMTPAEAFAELRNVAGRQLDADLVDDLIVMLQRDGADLLATDELQRAETELAFSRLAAAMAEPADL